MSDPRESQSSSAPVVPARKYVAEESTKKFLQDLFAQGAHFEDCFRKICDSGCPPEEFGPLLCGTCMILSVQSTAPFHAGKLSESQLRGLPKRLRDLAAIIGALNASPLAPSNEVHFMPDAPEGMPARQYLVQRYKMLPGMLYVYAEHIERFSRIVRTTFKRLTGEHILAITMLRYVENQTGRPQYSELSELLEQGCRIAGGEKANVPRFLTAEGLAKLYQRWGNAVLGPRA